MSDMPSVLFVCVHNAGARRWLRHTVQQSDVVVTMGCGDTCPYFPGKRYEDWVLDDPAGHGVEAVRPIRDEIRGRVETLLRELGLEPLS